LLLTRCLHLSVQRERAELAGRLRECEAAERAEGLRRAAATERILDVLARSDIEIVFQPIVDLKRGAIVGFEALSRFKAEPARSPDEWFAEAHAVGHGRDLELLAIDIAFRSLDQIPQDAFLSVNISPTLLVNGDFAEFMRGRDTARVVVEVTEHARIDDYESLSRSIAALRRRGIRIAVDDAGAGFASLQHILKLQPDIVKLDIALVRDIDTDPVRRALASSLAFFGNEVGARLVAEGIETQSEETALCDLGVHLGQGYFLGRPGPLPIAAEVGVR
jgi:EAL domain-containing protein (putative c-di-GMP-specific phosphodiesterase class I)